MKKRFLAVLLCMIMVLLLGSAQAANPCEHNTGASLTFQCEVCMQNVCAMVNALPDMWNITDANAEQVKEQLQEIVDAVNGSLTEAARDELMKAGAFEKWYAASFVLTAPDNVAKFAIGKAYVDVSAGNTPNATFTFYNEDEEPVWLTDANSATAANVELEGNGASKYFYLPAGTYTVNETVDGEWKLSMSVNGAADSDLTFTAEAGKNYMIELCNSYPTAAYVNGNEVISGDDWLDMNGFKHDRIASELTLKDGFEAGVAGGPDDDDVRAGIYAMEGVTKKIALMGSARISVPASESNGSYYGIYSESDLRISGASLNISLGSGFESAYQAAIKAPLVALELKANADCVISGGKYGIDTETLGLSFFNSDNTESTLTISGKERAINGTVSSFAFPNGYSLYASKNADGSNPEKIHPRDLNSTAYKWIKIAPTGSVQTGGGNGSGSGNGGNNNEGVILPDNSEALGMDAGATADAQRQSLPQTGDASMIGLWAALAILSAAGVAMVSSRKKKA